MMHEIDAYMFWPAKKVEALFSKKMKPEKFYEEMHKLWDTAVDTVFDPCNELQVAIEEWSTEKQAALLKSIRKR